jgi:phospholipase C
VIGIRSEYRNIGNLLNDKGVTWGFFQGGFRISPSTGCSPDYIPHHEPFQYYLSTANPHHVPPASPSRIGTSGDAANHQYDLEDFWLAADHGNLPRVSFLKAKASQDGHAGYSNPIDEQKYLVATLNRLQSLPQWKEMLVLIAYDDSDGWYDHVVPPLVSGSHSDFDGLSGSRRCGPENEPARDSGRCGLGPRLPFLAISPYSRENYVDHRLTEQTSILKFIEDNWNLGRIGNGSFDERAGSLESLLDLSGKPRNTRLFLDPATGTPVARRP